MEEFNSDDTRKVFECVTKFIAVGTTAKRYHWQCFGKTFEGDHELFDRIYDTFFKPEYLDKVAECLAMRNETSELNIVNDLVEMIANKEGHRYMYDDLLDNVVDSMFKVLRDLITGFVILTNQELGENIPTSMKPMFDEMFESADQIRGLIDARLKFSKVLSRLEKSIKE